MNDQKINTLSKKLIQVITIGLSLALGTAYAGEVARKPASNYSEDAIMIPLQKKHWVNQLLVDDEQGTLQYIKQEFENWEAEEEYVKNWNLELTGMYTPKTQEDKKKRIRRDSLKYLDNRLAGEMKTAEKGSALAQVKTIETAMRPSAKVAVSENVKIKFKAKVLQGKADIIVDNPYVDCNAEVKSTGKVNVNISKSISDLGVKTGVEYQVSNGVWIASVNKQLTESVSTEVSSYQKDSNMMFTEQSDKRIKVLYTKSF
ncbi:MAG: hypothetical protein U0T83_10380 [Bacteriovoracaceae bacterium]